MEGPTFSLLNIQFGHDCRNVGCNLHGCELCRNNPNRRCQSHFREKYVDNANRVFTAWCKAPILARVVDSATGDEYTADGNGPSKLDGVLLQLCLLEGNAYDQLDKGSGPQSITPQEYESMMLLDNTSSSTNEPLLVPGKGCPGEHTADNKLLVPLEPEGTPILVRSSRSSQSAQGGRTRPFRLMARAIWRDGTTVPYILPDVSENFVVTTRRTQGAEKALVPRWDDSVSKLPGVGKETFAKLKDLRAAGLSARLNNYRILTVGQLFELIDQAAPLLLSDLGRALGLKHDKIVELQQNARTVAREDSRKRVFGSPDYPSDRLLYPCSGGAVDLLREHIEVMRDTDDGAEIISTEDLPGEDLYRVVEMRQLAFASWWAPGHPGWGIIDEFASPSGSAQVAAEVEAVPTLSLRQQMDRQCKQRRYLEPTADGFPDAFPDPVEDERRRLEQQHFVLKSELHSEPSYDFEHSSDSVSAPEHCVPARSVFDVDVFPDHGENLATSSSGFQQHDNYREVNPNADNIVNAPSAEALLEQPIGLAYITSAPLYERSGPIRFKRTVSGNRYKPMPAEQAHPPLVSVANGAYAPIFEGRPANLSPLPQQQPVGVFQGLPPRPSRELRSQTSLDKVASWQQTRPLSTSNLGERFSQNMLLSLFDESTDIDYDQAVEFGF